VAFEVAFSSNDDEVIADAVTIWIIGGDQAPLGSFASYFAKRVESNSPFSPRLRQVAIRAIELTWRRELEVHRDWKLFAC
jgi:cyanophycinase-like exopeptidase